MTLLPFRCHPLLKSRVWGGEQLLKWNKSLPGGNTNRWGESWELADLPEDIPDGRSIIQDGPLALAEKGDVACSIDVQLTAAKLKPQALWQVVTTIR